MRRSGFLTSVTGRLSASGCLAEFAMRVRAVSHVSPDRSSHRGDSNMDTIRMDGANTERWERLCWQCVRGDSHH